jgi:DNA-binding NarL/FixJ family response regulator
MKRIFNIAIVDDHFAVRDGYKFCTEKIPFIQSVDTYESFEHYQNSNNVYDLILLDIEMKTSNGLDKCKMLKNSGSSTKIIMLSSYHDESFIVEAYQNKADGYLFKDAPYEEVLLALEKVLIKGDKHFNLEAIEIIFNDFESSRKYAKLAQIKITKREIEIIQLICEGMSNKEISATLHRSITTISKHRYNIMQKYGFHKSIELVNFATQKGIYKAKKNTKKSNQHENSI